MRCGVWGRRSGSLGREGITIFLNIFKRYKVSKNYLIIFLIIFFTFFRTLTLKSYTSWDTFDLHTINFVYLSDALRSGTLALWNPFVLSGIPVLPNLYTSYFYAPIDFILLCLSFWVDPIWLVEFSIAILSLLFSIGLHKSLRISGVTSRYALPLSLVGFYILIPPIVGQLSFVVSFVMASWLFYFCMQTTKDSFQIIFLKAFFIMSLFAKGYFYFNGVIFIFAFFLTIYSCRNMTWKDSALFFIYNRFLFFFLPLVLFFILNYEALHDWKDIYKGMLGDFLSEEPRLRSLIVSQPFFIGSFTETLNAIFSISFPAWSKGFYYFSPLCFFGLLLFLYTKKILIREKIVFFGVFALGVLLSTYTKWLSDLWLILPFFNSFRWCVNHIFISLFISLYAIGRALSLSDECTEKSKLNGIRLAWVIIIFSMLLSMFNHYSFRDKSWKRTSKSLEMYKNRKINTTYYVNTRRLNNSKIFKYDDFNWLYKKEAMSHGYNNAVSEIYWRTKDYLYNHSFFSFPQQVFLEPKYDRVNFQSDRDFVEAKIKNIDSTARVVLAQSTFIQNNNSEKSISHFSFTPNKISAELASSKPAFVFLTQHFHRGWKLLINGKSSELERVNYIFCGFKIAKGVSRIELLYWPVTATVLILFYSFLIIVFLSMNIYNFKKSH